MAEIVVYNELYAPERDGKRWGPARYGAYVFTAEGPIEWLDLGPVATLHTVIRRFRLTISSAPNRGGAKAAAKEIRRAVIDPICNLLPATKEWYISPDGLLRLIPLAALPEEAGSSQPVTAGLQLHTITTARDLMRGAPVHSVQPAWIAGIADFGGDPASDSLLFPPIPGAKEEVEAVAKIIRPKAQLLALEQMTKTFLLEKMNAPRVLHLATHGYYHDDSGGGLALKDANVSTQNILTQNDVAKLRLLGSQLVVLSACESGMGEVSFADGIIGLQRSLTLAGSRSQILTLWPVDDAKTKELMVAFYGNLFDKGMTKSEALRQAQLAMARDGLDMYFWAAFVLYGDSGPLGE